MNPIFSFFIASFVCFFLQLVFLKADDAPVSHGISGNPGATNILTGTGELGKRLNIPESSGFRLGGLWIGDCNDLISGGNGIHHNRRWTCNSLFILDLFVDLEKAAGWKETYFGAEFLQFNGQPTNEDAGVAQGYNGLPGEPPLNRSELYQIWLLKRFWNDKFSVRIGKTVPIYHFNNVTKPVPVDNPALSIASVTGLIYTPIFVNTTLLGLIGGYYNSVYGVTATITPIKEAYINIGFYDGNVARGVQTGLTGPHFNGYYFSIIEGGYGWGAPKPGILAIGAWHQSGVLKAGLLREVGTGGLYAFGSQALWISGAESKNKQNISGFFQLGWNNSRTRPMNRFAGLGLTGFGFTPNRPNDSFGVGVACSKLNTHTFKRASEIMFQGYYQAAVYKSIYFQPVCSYIPNPGEHPHKSNVWALTGRMTALF